MLLCAFSSFHTLHAETPIFLIGSMLAITFASIMLLLIIKFSTFETRKYAISEIGIRLNDKKKSYYAWSEISEVAIIGYAAAASLQSYQSVVCVFLEPKTKDSLNKILCNNFYGYFHQECFVLIDYTPSVLNEFVKFFPGEIVDYRKADKL